MSNTFDVVVVGSGSAGMMAALRAADHGLRVLMVEKAHKYGGTSATSGGGIWMPNHGLTETTDSRDQALQYIAAVSRGAVRRDRQEAYVDTCPLVVRYLTEVGVKLYVLIGYTDYYPALPGAREDRSVLTVAMDGGELGDEFHTMREQFPRFKLFNRYAFDIDQLYSISTRAKGWQWVALKMITRYWLDRDWRKKTQRDRRLTMGAALIGGLRKALIARNVPLWLGTGLEQLIVNEGRVTGVELSRFGRRFKVEARHGVVIASGGFEWNQSLRDKYMEFPTVAKWSTTPEEGNKGEATIAGQAIGAATEFMNCAWWAPTMLMPIESFSNMESSHQAIFDVGRPHSICVNRNGVRFGDEACGYDQFGINMLNDHRATGANLPCWAVFDTNHRNKFTCGGILPPPLMPDSKIPPSWWDHYIFKADSIAALAGKIGINPAALVATVERFNGFSKAGVDTDFGRGGNSYDRFFGDPSVTPNPCLGEIATGPFYAVPINLGDLGTKGGLKTDARGRVLDLADRPIPGLYAAGNASGAVWGDAYPGSGGTIGPAMVFGYLAAEDIAQRKNSSASNNLEAVLATPS